MGTVLRTKTKQNDFLKKTKNSSKKESWLANYFNGA